MKIPSYDKSVCITCKNCKNCNRKLFKRKTLRANKEHTRIVYYSCTNYEYTLKEEAK